MTSEVFMLKFLLTSFILIGVIFRYTIDEDIYKIIFDVAIILTIMYFVWG